MTSKYTPPHMRTAKVTPDVEIAKESVEEFPSLGTGVAKPVVVGEHSMAKLAASWSKNADEKKFQEDARREDQDTLELLRRRHTFPMPQFHNIRRFVEPEETEEAEEAAPATQIDPEESGWVEVRSKRKPRKQKSFEEEMNRPQTPEDTTADTVWNSHEEGDTYWH
jgi:hypothetical protein